MKGTMAALLMAVMSIPTPSLGQDSKKLNAAPDTAQNSELILEQEDAELTALMEAAMKAEEESELNAIRERRERREKRLQLSSIDIDLPKECQGAMVATDTHWRSIEQSRWVRRDTSQSYFVKNYLIVVVTNNNEYVAIGESENPEKCLDALAMAGML